MKSYEKLAVSVGAKTSDVFRLKPGESVLFENGNATRGPVIHTKEVLVHGLGIGDIGKVVLTDRTALGKEGVVVAAVKINRDGKVTGRPELTSRGFVFEPGYGGVLDDAAIELDRSLQNKKLKDTSATKNLVTQFLEKYFFEKTRRNPMILPVVVEI